MAAGASSGTSGDGSERGETEGDRPREGDRAEVRSAITSADYSSGAAATYSRQASLRDCAPVEHSGPDPRRADAQRRDEHSH